MAAKKESKREKFVRMAEARTIKIISMVRLLGNCSNRLAYEYSEKDAPATCAPCPWTTPSCCW